MLRCTVRSPAALLAGGVFLLSSLVAFAQQPGGEQKPPEQAQGEQKQEGKPESDQKSAEQAKAEQQEADQAIEEYKEAAAKLSSSAGAPECVWTGRRIASLLWRDDMTRRAATSTLRPLQLFLRAFEARLSLCD
jgi:cytoskeletal protein RodZ